MDSSVNRKIGARRVRRTPEDARRLILDAAEACMGADGPAGLRLTQVAAQAGVSHPTLLHHFGSRDALITAVHRRAVEGMGASLRNAMQGSSRGGDVIGIIFDAYRNGLADRLVWMCQSGFDMPAAPGAPANAILARMVDELHALRLRLAPPGAEVREDDTAAIVHLTALAAFGDAVIGRRLRNAGDDAAEIAARDRFEDWFRTLIGRAMVQQGVGSG